MIKDFSFGQYYPQDSIVHKLDPRLKLVLLVSYIVFVFVAFNFSSLLLLSAFLFFMIAITKIPVSVYFKNIKVILPIIIFTSILNAVYVTDGVCLVSFWIIKFMTKVFKKQFLCL